MFFPSSYQNIDVEEWANESYEIATTLYDGKFTAKNETVMISIFK